MMQAQVAGHAHVGTVYFWSFTPTHAMAEVTKAAASAACGTSSPSPAFSISAVHSPHHAPTSASRPPPSPHRASASASASRPPLALATAPSSSSSSPPKVKLKCKPSSSSSSASSAQSQTPSGAGVSSSHVPHSHTQNIVQRAQASHSHGGRLLKKQASERVPDAFVCPITHEMMREPVMLLADSHTYERTAIEEWFATGSMVSPMTGNEVASSETKRNFSLRNAIEQYLVKFPHHAPKSPSRVSPLRSSPSFVAANSSNVSISLKNPRHDVPALSLGNTDVPASAKDLLSQAVPSQNFRHHAPALSLGNTDVPASAKDLSAAVALQSSRHDLPALSLGNTDVPASAKDLLSSAVPVKSSRHYAPALSLGNTDVPPSVKDLLSQVASPLTYGSSFRAAEPLNFVPATSPSTSVSASSMSSYDPNYSPRNRPPFSSRAQNVMRSSMSLSQSESSNENSLSYSTATATASAATRRENSPSASSTTSNGSTSSSRSRASRASPALSSPVHAASHSPRAGRNPRKNSPRTSLGSRFPFKGSPKEKGEGDEAGLSSISSVADKLQSFAAAIASRQHPLNSESCTIGDGSSSSCKPKFQRAKTPKHEPRKSSGPLSSKLKARVRTPKSKNRKGHRRTHSGPNVSHFLTRAHMSPFSGASQNKANSVASRERSGTTDYVSARSAFAADTPEVSPPLKRLGAAGKAKKKKQMSALTYVSMLDQIEVRRKRRSTETKERGGTENTRTAESVVAHGEKEIYEGDIPPPPPLEELTGNPKQTPRTLFPKTTPRARSTSKTRAKPLKYMRVSALARATPFLSDKASSPESSSTTPRAPIVVLGGSTSHVSSGHSAPYADEPHSPTPFHAPADAHVPKFAASHGSNVEDDDVDEVPSPLSPRPTGASPPPPLDLSRRSSSSSHDGGLLVSLQDSTSGPSPPNKSLPPPPPPPPPCYSEEVGDSLPLTVEIDSDPKATAKKEDEKPAAVTSRPNPFADFPAPPPLIVSTSIPGPGVGIRGGGPGLTVSSVGLGVGGLVSGADPPPAVHLPVVSQPKPRRYTYHTHSAEHNSANFHQLIGGGGSADSPVADRQGSADIGAAAASPQHTPRAASVVLATHSAHPASMMMSGVVSGRASRTNSGAQHQRQRSFTPQLGQLGHHVSIPHAAASGSDTSTPSSPRAHEAQVTAFLARINCSQYAERLFADGYDSMDALKEVTDEELNELKVKKGHRKVILRRVAEWHTFTQVDASPATYVNPPTTPGSMMFQSDGMHVPQFFSYGGTPSHIVTPHTMSIHSVPVNQQRPPSALQFTSLPGSRSQTPDMSSTASSMPSYGQRAASEYHQPLTTPKATQPLQKHATPAFSHFEFGQHPPPHFSPAAVTFSRSPQAENGGAKAGANDDRSSQSPPSRSKSPQPAQLSVPKQTAVQTRESRSQSCDGYFTSGGDAPETQSPQLYQQYSGAVYQHDPFASSQTPSPSHNHPQARLQPRSPLALALAYDRKSAAPSPTHATSMSLNVETAEVSGSDAATAPAGQRLQQPRGGDPSTTRRLSWGRTLQAFQSTSPPVFTQHRFASRSVSKEGGAFVSAPSTISKRSARSMLNVDGPPAFTGRGTRPRRSHTHELILESPTTSKTTPMVSPSLPPAFEGGRHSGSHSPSPRATR